MKRLPLVIALAIAGLFLAFNKSGATDDPPSKYEKIMQIIGAMIRQEHVNPKSINDEFSKKVYQRYFEEMDNEKLIFLQKDIDDLKRFSTKIDDEVNGAPVEFFLEVSKIFDKRVDEGVALYKDLLAKPFDFTVKETVVTDDKKTRFANSATERREKMRKYLKYLALQRYVELQEAREANKGREGVAVKSDADLEKEARDKVLVLMDRVYDRNKTKFNNDERFSVYVNTITNMMDPYTEFMLPIDKRAFYEQMSNSFFGIGAQLTYDEGTIKIVSIIPGGPAQKSNEVEVGDAIVRVAQAGEQPVDLTGYAVEDAVKLIRGKKGTQVTLTLRKKDGTLKPLTLTRDKIVQDEGFARSAVITQNNAKIGYIYLPDFYANFEDPTAPRSSTDVAKEILKLKAEGVEGIVLDLRNNGGGALHDAIQIAGMFIDRGPVVQVKDRESMSRVMEDRNSGVLWDGPLTVMVNEFSASASEILAAAIQDYGRGVVIGSTSTYGKGTVQQGFGLDPRQTENDELGSLKLTIQKFYRVSGGSTQKKGVVPDVIVPDYNEYLKFRERDNENALPYDEIKKATYSLFQPGYSFESVKNLAKARIANDSVFNMIKAQTDILAHHNDKEYPLEIEQYKKDQKVTRDAIKKIEKLIKLDASLTAAFPKSDESRYVSEDKDKTERYKQWLSNISKDVYIDQAIKVLNDMVAQHRLAKGQSAPARTF